MTYANPPLHRRHHGRALVETRGTRVRPAGRSVSGPRRGPPGTPRRVHRDHHRQLRGGLLQPAEPLQGAAQLEPRVVVGRVGLHYPAERLLGAAQPGRTAGRRDRRVVARWARPAPPRAPVPARAAPPTGGAGSPASPRAGSVRRRRRRSGPRRPDHRGLLRGGHRRPTLRAPRPSAPAGPAPAVAGGQAPPKAACRSGQGPHPLPPTTTGPA